MPAAQRDAIVAFLLHWHQRAELALGRLIAWAGISRNRFYDWVKRREQPNQHNAPIPKRHWILPWEKDAIIRYATEHLEAGYRRLTYLMLDENVVAVSPSTTYRVLAAASLLSRPRFGPSKKGSGFDQPLNPHEHWHIDFTYLKLSGTFYFLIAVLDGCSRAILAWDINETMTERDAEIVLQRAREIYPGHHPRIISDNGSQFLAKDFRDFIRICEMTHVTTSPYYPQSNGKIERFNQSIKAECLRPLCPLSPAEARRITARYIGDYNEVRLHGAIGYIAPMARLENRHEAIFAQRALKLVQARSNRSAPKPSRAEIPPSNPVAPVSAQFQHSNPGFGAGAPTESSPLQATNAASAPLQDGYDQ
jgi:transposase InsO family protein